MQPRPGRLERPRVESGERPRRVQFCNCAQPLRGLQSVTGGPEARRHHQSESFVDYERRDEVAGLEACGGELGLEVLERGRFLRQRRRRKRRWPAKEHLSSVLVQSLSLEAPL